MLIPPDRLNPETLKGLIEEFITREGTDYGVFEVALPVKIEQVKQQLLSGEVLIVFDAASESVNLLTKNDYQQLNISE